MISHWKTGARYEQVLKLMIEQFPEVEKRDKVEVLELAAGTGGVGEQLHRHGFRSMDAVDGSVAMLAQLGKKGLYRRSWVALLGKDQKPILNVSDKSYDVVIMCGGRLIFKPSFLSWTPLTHHLAKGLELLNGVLLAIPNSNTSKCTTTKHCVSETLFLF